MEFWDSLVSHFHHHLVILAMLRHGQRISTQLTLLLSCTYCWVKHKHRSFPDLVWQFQFNGEHNCLQVKWCNTCWWYLTSQSLAEGLVMSVESLRWIWHFSAGFTSCRYPAHNCLELGKGTACTLWFLALQHLTWSYLAWLALDLPLCKV